MGLVCGVVSCVMEVGIGGFGGGVEVRYLANELLERGGGC